MTSSLIIWYHFWLTGNICIMICVFFFFFFFPFLTRLYLDFYRALVHFLWRSIHFSMTIHLFLYLIYVKKTFVCHDQKAEWWEINLSMRRRKYISRTWYLVRQEKISVGFFFTCDKFMFFFLDILNLFFSRFFFVKRFLYIWKVVEY